MKLKMSIFIMVLMLLLPSSISTKAAEIESKTTTHKQPANLLEAARLESTFNINAKDGFNLATKDTTINTSDFKPSDFQLFPSAGVQLLDMYGVTHEMYYTGIYDLGYGNGEVDFSYYCNEDYYKSYYMYIGFYKESNGTITPSGELYYWDLTGTTYSNFYHIFSSSDFANQKYIYMTLAVSDEYYGDYVDDYVNVKVENPFYVTDWEDHWAATQIQYAMDKGWVNTTNNFRPDDAITRAEFVKIVNKAFGFTAKATSESFTDVSSSNWYYNDVLIGLKAGYISNKNSTFRPDDPITREEVAVILTSIKNNKDTKIDKLNSYTDKSQVSSWALSSVEGAIEAGYMGKGSTQFRPKANITRAEAIVTLCRVVN